MFLTRDIEFMTTYPTVGGHPEEKTLLMVARDKELGRVPIYAPRVIHKNITMEQKCETAQYRDFHRNIVVGEFVTNRSMTINGELWVLPEDDKDTFFSIHTLDKSPARRVKKEEIEKLFGCVIDG
jgi:hypothetical protein